MRNLFCLTCSVCHTCLRMFRFVLLLLTVSGLQAIPIAVLRGLQKTSSTYQLPDGFQKGIEHADIHRPIPDSFRQGTELSGRLLVDLNTGLVQDNIAVISPFLGNGFGEMERRHWPTDEIPVDVPAQKNGDGWVRVEVPTENHLPDGFRQGTEPEMLIQDGFRQGTKHAHKIPAGFRQGTEPFKSIPDGFRQGTEPFKSIPDGFRQGTEPFKSIPDGSRQGTEPSASRIQTHTVSCKGEVINGNCYEFNPTQMAFQDAQVICRALAPNAELASVTSSDLHSRLVSLVTKGGEKNPVLTWLGGTIKNQKASWVDGSEWSYSDWKPGHPNIRSDKPVCLEMFQIDESWWTAADCDLRRASICSYPIIL
nr:PREDICTED: uncharacterized protein LOC109639758 isoform X2 [Paralichthys olivaceus]XP_019958958.1 PREDICTED: uncharacterized protein LOC109639758 isoform X3 [Paralichthys olivaceus]